MTMRFVWLFVAVLGLVPIDAAEEAPPEEAKVEEAPPVEELPPAEALNEESPPKETPMEAPPGVESTPPEEAPPAEQTPVASGQDTVASSPVSPDTPVNKTPSTTKSAAPSPTWSSHDKTMQVMTKDGKYIPAQEVLSSKNHTTTAGRVVVANAKKFTSYVTLFKSPGGRCYSVVLPMELKNIKVGQTMPLLAGYKHKKPFVSTLSGFKDVLRGNGCRRWKKITEVAVLFPVFRSAKEALPVVPLWHLKEGKTLVSNKKDKPQLTSIGSQTDMYKVPGLLQINYEGKANITTTIMKSATPQKITTARTIFRDDQGGCVIAEADVKDVSVGSMYSGAPLMHKYNRDYATILRDLRGDDWIEPFACKNVARVPLLAAVYGYGK